MASHDPELLESVAKELERLLSKENLAEDQAIASALNPQLCVPIATLLEVESLKALTTESEVVVAAASQSQLLGLSNDNTMLRPLLKSKRNTLILRDVPEGVTEAELRDLLAKAPKTSGVQEVTPDINNTWFVVFGTESEAQDVAWWLRSQELKGSKVSVSMKSEHFLRSFFPANPEPKPNDFSSVPGFDPAKGKGFMPPPFPFYPAMMKGMFPPMMMKGKGKGKAPMAMPGKGGDAATSLLKMLQGGEGKGAKKKGRNAKAGVAPKAMMYPGMMPGMMPGMFPGMPMMPGMPGMGMPVTPVAAAETQPQPVSAEVASVLANKTGTVSAAVLDPENQEPCEYQHEFRKYVRQDFLDICSKMKQPIPKPEVYNAVEHLKICSDSSALGFTAKPSDDDPKSPPQKAGKKKKEGDKKAKKEEKEEEYTQAEWDAWYGIDNSKSAKKSGSKSSAQQPAMKWVAKKA